MRILQLMTLGLFGLFSVLTAYFQLRAGMKNGEITRTDAQEAVRAAEQSYSRMANRSAITAVAFLALCMALGAISR